MREPWYVEEWYDDDLVNALDLMDVPATEENINRLRAECLHLFDDKSTRNEMICNLVDRLFG